MDEQTIEQYTVSWHVFVLVQPFYELFRDLFNGLCHAEYSIKFIQLVCTCNT